ncbi:MAG: NRDE family protein [Proteobacteria bacterium]|nr:NRDE family protein [Pseudomonadota bacterium]
MCLILLGWRVHPRFPLVVAANRDEFHARATQAARFWRALPQVLAGRDLASGGTWLGVSRDARFAAVTNFRDFDAPASGDIPSRGELTVGFLAGTTTPSAWADAVATRASTYRGFNLLVADRDALWWVSNRGGGARKLEPGVYGLSNHLLDTPWPKVAIGKARFAQALERGPSFAALFALLADATRHDVATGIGDTAAQREHLLSAARIVSPEYGTRCSSVLSIDDDRQTRFAERSWDPAGAVRETIQREFDTVA